MKLRSTETSVSAQTVYTPKVEVEIVGDIPEEDKGEDKSWFGKTAETAMLIGLGAAGFLLLLCGGCMWYLKSSSNKLRERERAHHKRKVPKNIKPPERSNDVELLRVTEGNEVTRESPGSRLTQGRTNSTTYKEEEESGPSRISLGAIYKDAARSMSNLSYVVKPPNIPPPPKVSDPWDAVWDRAQKKYYFFNHNTNETTWSQPS